MTKSAETQTLTRVGDRLAMVLDDALLARLGITAETAMTVTEAGGSLLITPRRDPAREAAFTTALGTMSKRYEQVMRRLAK